MHLELHSNKVTDVLHVAQPKLPSTGRIVLIVIMSWSIKIRNCTNCCTDRDCLQGCLLVMCSTSVSTQNDRSWCNLFIYSSKRKPSFSCWYHWVSCWYCLLHVQSRVSWKTLSLLGSFIVLSSCYASWKESLVWGEHLPFAQLKHCCHLVLSYGMADQCPRSLIFQVSESCIRTFCGICGQRYVQAGEHVPREKHIDSPKWYPNT